MVLEQCVSFLPSLGHMCNGTPNSTGIGKGSQTLMARILQESLWSTPLFARVGKEGGQLSCYRSDIRVDTLKLSGLTLR